MKEGKMLAILVFLMLNTSFRTATELDTGVDSPQERQLNDEMPPPKGIKDNSRYKFNKIKYKIPIHDCMLGARVFPLKFIGKTKTMEFALELKSNCMQYSTLNYFILPYNSKMGLTQNIHPKKVILGIYNRIYYFTFTKKEKKGKRSNIKVQYNKVSIIPTIWLKPTNVKRSNDVVLRTTLIDPFTKKEMERILSAKNPTLCKISKNREEMYCEI